MVSDALLIETRCCSLPDLGFFAVYASARFAQNKANDDRMRQSLLFSVCVSEEKERHKHGGKESSQRVCVYACVGV